jgi:hypothetical protein
MNWDSRDVDISLHLYLKWNLEWKRYKNKIMPSKDIEPVEVVVKKTLIEFWLISSFKHTF